MPHDAACEHQRLLRYALDDAHVIDRLTLCEEHAEERRIALQHLRDRQEMRETQSFDAQGRPTASYRVPRGLSLLEARMLVEALRVAHEPEPGIKPATKARKTKKNEDSAT